MPNNSPLLLNCPIIQNFSLFPIFVCTPVFCYFQFWFSLLYSYNVGSYTQIHHKYSSFSLYLLLSHRGFFEQPLFFVKSIPLPLLFSLLPLLEWALLSPTEKAFPISSTILVVMVLLVAAPAIWGLISPILVVSSVFLSFFYSLFNTCSS